jgi:diguanylate cyclase (GGDEF)-like protein/PAS domain S-box-containing protein
MARRSSVAPPRGTRKRARATGAEVGVQELPSQSQAAESEQRCKHLLESMFDWVWEVDEHLRIAYSSAGVPALLGYTAEETVGKTLLAFVAPDDLPRVQPAFSKILSNRTAFRDLEMWCLRFSGERICLLSSGVPIIDAQGQLRGFQGVTTDITEKQRAEEALRVATERLALATRVARLGVWDWDLRSNLTTWDDTMFEIYGLPRLVPMPYEMWSGTVHPDDLPGAEASLQRAIATQGQDEVRFRITRPDGAARVIKAAEGAVVGADGKVSRLVGVNIDITDQQNAEEELVASEGRYRRLFETAKDGILILDLQSGAIVDVNPFLTELLGYSRGELIGKKLWEIGFQSDVEESEALFERLRREGYVRYEDLPLETRDGRSIDVEFVSNSYVVDRQQVIQCNIRDITNRKRTEETLRRRTAQLEVLGQVNLGITAQLDLDTLLRTITERALTLFGANACELFLYRPDRDVLELALAAGIGVSDARPELRLGEGFAGKVWQASKALVGSKALHWPEGTDTGKWFLWGSALGAPIRARNEVLGVLSVLSMKPEAFSEADAELVELFATQAAVAIVNARLYAEVEDLTLLDELTQTFNRRGLLTLGPREVERSRRFRRPAAALYVDVDHFDTLNDRFSHEVGDRFLQVISRRIEASVRTIDIVARYRGEEFVVLLGEANAVGARVVAERIRHAVEATSLPTENGPAGMTVSIGIAMHGPGVADLETLIRRASEAVSVAQQRGGNRIVEWEA